MPYGHHIPGGKGVASGPLPPSVDAWPGRLTPALRLPDWPTGNRAPPWPPFASAGAPQRHASKAVAAAASGPCQDKPEPPACLLVNLQWVVWGLLQDMTFHIGQLLHEIKTHKEPIGVTKVGAPGYMEGRRLHPFIRSTCLRPRQDGLQPSAIQNINFAFSVELVGRSFSAGDFRPNTCVRNLLVEAFRSKRFARFVWHRGTQALGTPQRRATRIGGKVS